MTAITQAQKDTLEDMIGELSCQHATADIAWHRDPSLANVDAFLRLDIQLTALVEAFNAIQGA